MLIPEIDRLLEADENNVRETREIFSRFSPDLPEAIDRAANLFSTCVRAYGQGIPDHYKIVSDKMRAAGFQSIDEFEKASLGSQSRTAAARLTSAQAALDDFYSRENRGLLCGKIGVWYAIAAADFLRMRVTAPLACVRLQCESLALMKLMLDQPAIAREWQQIVDESKGRQFFNAHQPQIKKTLEEYELLFAYDSASSIAMHSRFAGLALGIKHSTTIKGARITKTLKINVQEVDPEDPDIFLIFVLHFLRVQDRIFSRIAEASPEIADPLLLETRIPQFHGIVEELMQKFSRRSPSLAAEYQANIK